MRTDESFSIRQMIDLTGLSEFTIRGWENRYRAFTPRRSVTGRREYSKTDIERALLLRELLKRGHKISKVAGHPNSKLKKLFASSENLGATTPGERGSKLVSEAMRLMALQKWSDLRDLFRNLKFKNNTQLVHEFFLPALHALSTNVEDKVVSISQEHVFSSFLKEKIYASLYETERGRTSRSPNQKVHFILATPEGDHHELGLLLAHLLIRSFGFNSLYLGPHTPPQDLSETALRLNASHVLITSTVSKKTGAAQDLLSFVSEVQTRIGSHAKILLCGRQAPLLTNDSDSPLLKIDSFRDFENYLENLGGKL